MGLKQEIVLDNISSEEVRCLAALRLALLILAAVLRDLIAPKHPIGYLGAIQMHMYLHYDSL
jgi:hypothetical protein